MEAVMTTRAISEIDRDITANARKLLRLHPIKHRDSARDWQAAWDLEPELMQRDRGLYLERGMAQLERDQRAYAAVKQALLRQPRGKKCPTCKRPGWREAA
jgi:hypothetical protein